MYAAADLRKNVYFTPKLFKIGTTDYPNIIVVNKYQGNPLLFTGANSNYQQAPKIFRVAELYLIAAEAGANLRLHLQAGGRDRIRDVDHR